MNWHYLYIFFQSNLLEVLFLVFFYPMFAKSRPQWLKVALFVTLANSMTHPWVVFFLVKGPWTYIGGILVAEAFAIVSEVFLHRYALGLNYREAIIGSVVANLISWQLGPLLTGILFLSDKL